MYDPPHALEQIPRFAQTILVEHRHFKVMTDAATKTVTSP
jgi:hypothetical protein